MRNAVKYSIIGLLSLTATIFITRTVRRKVRKNKLDKPCRGKQCVEDVNGKLLYLVKSYVNVRDSAEVNNKDLPFDWVDNLIGEVTTNPIGRVINQVTGSDNLNWYKIELTQPLDGETIGYVREDVVSTNK